MRKFLIQIAVFFALMAAVMLWLLSRSDGYTDAFYMRFKAPAQTSLLLGTSRAAQGMVPEIFNQRLQRSDIFNYAFTNENSPYGEIYFKSIQRKLSEDGKDGIFVLSVDPWSLSSDVSDPDNSEKFREVGLTLDKLSFVSMNPNIPYMVTCFEGQYLDLIDRKRDTSLFLHADGWLEVKVPMNESSVAKRTKNKIGDYRDNILPKYKFSNVRFDYLKKTILFLKEHGSVYLVRLPVHPDMFVLEDKLMADFDQLLKECAVANGIDYLSYKDSVSGFEFTDGNHLAVNSAYKVSTQIAESISQKSGAH